MADIVLINPRFEVSYWGLEHALPLLGKRANLPVSCLPLLAALTPEGHTVTLIDENVEEIDWERCARADIVGLTGMSVQRFRMREILEELKERGLFTVVGGPWVTVSEDYFGDLADVIFVGEAEETWPQFLREWKQGLHQVRYEQIEKTNMTKVPVPRFDLLKMDRYLFGSLQFSRGCPFQCEFCDIIVTFGRRPRLKTADQIILELEALRREGMRTAFIVDDNLIGNKKGIKPLLAAVAEWQEKNGYPMSFFTEASIDLADDDELLELMNRIDVVGVFIGIESPSEEALKHTKKFQNVRQGNTLLGRVHKIQRAGMDVWCGMILGFDTDDETIFDRQREFLLASRITSSMIGMLHAIPKTPLHARLEAEGRLDHSDTPEFGTNIIPLLIDRATLRDGYLDVMTDMHETESFFERMEELFIREKMLLGCRNRHDYWRKHPIRYAKTQITEYVGLAILYARVVSRIPDPAFRAEFRRRFRKLFKVRRDSGVLIFFIFKCTMLYHAQTMVRSFKTGERALVNSF